MLYCFLSFVFVCMNVYVLDHVLALRSSVDAEPLDEYQEPLSAEQFEQQQEDFEEGKYNMNILSLLNTISYCILILYAYKDFLATFILYINILGCILGSCARCCALIHLVLFN
jgi:hypothetical protein